MKLRSRPPTTCSSLATPHQTWTSDWVTLRGWTRLDYGITALTLSCTQQYNSTQISVILLKPLYVVGVPPLVVMYCNYVSHKTRCAYIRESTCCQGDVINVRHIDLPKLAAQSRVPRNWLQIHIQYQSKIMHHNYDTHFRIYRTDST